MNAIELTLGTNNSALKTGLDAAKGQVQGFKNEAHHLLMGLFAGVGIEQILEHFGKIKDMADTFGTTAEAVQRVDQYAQQFGITIDDVAKVMAKLRADSGALDKLGINAQEFSNADMDGQMLMLAEALEKIPDPQERINAAFEALGAKARKIIPALLEGSDAMKEFFENASVASNETVAALDAAGDKLTAFKNRVMVIGAEILGAVDKTTQSIGVILGYLFLNLENGFKRVNEAMTALVTFDFSGLKSAFNSNIEDIKNTANLAADELGKIWSPSDKPDSSLSKEQQSQVDAAAVASERKDLEERIAQIRADHAEKALDAETRLAHLVEQRKGLEEELANTAASDGERRKEISDQIVKNEQAQLATQDEIAKIEEKAGEERLKQLNKEADEYDKALKKKTDAEAKERENADKLFQKKQEQQEKLADRQKKLDFERRERELGFVSGIKEVGESRSGQRLAGVNYDVINAEAEKGIKLQQEMRDFLQTIAEKEMKLELPDAS